MYFWKGEFRLIGESLDYKNKNSGVSGVFLGDNPRGSHWGFWCKGKVWSCASRGLVWWERAALNSLDKEAFGRQFILHLHCLVSGWNAVSVSRPRLNDVNSSTMGQCGYLSHTMYGRTCWHLWLYQENIGSMLLCLMNFRNYNHVTVHFRTAWMKGLPSLLTQVTTSSITEGWQRSSFL